MKTLIIAVMLTVPLMAQTAQTEVKRQSPDVKVFGIQLGAAFTLPECHRTGYGKKMFMYDIGQKEWCYEYIGRSFTAPTGGPITNGSVEIVFPFSAAPQNVSGLFLMGKVIDGKLEAVSFNTTGLQYQNEVLKSLTDKYGPPSVSKSYEVKNLMGATFTAIRAGWLFSDLAVDYQAVDNSLDNGLVVIQTQKAMAAAAPTGTGTPL